MKFIEAIKEESSYRTGLVPGVPRVPIPRVRVHRFRFRRQFGSERFRFTQRVSELTNQN